jgi:BMFP domain-containing protein YqiC
VGAAREENAALAARVRALEEKLDALAGSGPAASGAGG